MFRHRGKEGIHIGLCFGGGLLVRLGENQRKRNAGFSQPVDEGEVDALGRQAGIDHGEHATEVFPRFEIVADGFVELALFAPRDLCESITREIHETPSFVHDKKVQQLRLARCGGNLCEILFVGKHVDH